MGLFLLSADEATIAPLPLAHHSENTPSGSQQPQIRNGRSLFGDSVAKTKKLLGPRIQEDMSATWSSIIENGLETEEKSNLKYPVPENAPLFLSSKLNEIVAKASSESVIRRDTRLAQLQTQVGATITAIGSALTIALSERGGDQPYVQPLCDAGRLLCDVFHMETTSRRELVCYPLEKSIKDTLISSPANEWLFGEDVDKRVEATKHLERAVKTLQPPQLKPIKKSIPKKTLNIRSLSRPTVQRGRRGGRQHYYQTNTPSYTPNRTRRDYHDQRPYRQTESSRLKRPRH